MASPQTIQPSGADNYLNEASKTTNYETNVAIRTRAYTNGRARTILKFDFSAVVPAGATITLATLSLYCTGTVAERVFTIYRLLHTDWVEAQSTWNIYKTGSSWGTIGALDTTTDITTTDAATANSVFAAQWLDVTVTAQVQTALDSVAGVAHFLMADLGANNVSFTVFSSNNATTEANRPKLYIEYTEAAAGPALLQTVNGLAKASVATKNGLVLASIKTWNGLA